jgi:hypothetical protein
MRSAAEHDRALEGGQDVGSKYGGGFQRDGGDRAAVGEA